jgi:fluoroacetyl-CoA thioesterase
VGEPTESERVVGTVTTTVTSADTARALGSGDVDVLGTPRVLVLVEAATVRAAAALVHLAPSPVGATVRAEAELVDRTGRRLTFEVRLTQDGRVVATGRVIRAVVDRARFAAQASTDERG